MRPRRFLHEIERNELAAREPLNDSKDFACRREQASVSEGPSGVKRIAVVRLPPHQALPKSVEDDRTRRTHPVLEPLPPLRRRDPRPQPLRRVEPGVAKTEGNEDPLASHGDVSAVHL